MASSSGCRNTIDDWAIVFREGYLVAGRRTGTTRREAGFDNEAAASRERMVTETANDNDRDALKGVRVLVV
jgi:hypothetical protein